MNQVTVFNYLAQRLEEAGVRDSFAINYDVTYLFQVQRLLHLI
jgi:TPP-dependent 2-oxoacid decarboxylase